MSETEQVLQACVRLLVKQGLADWPIKKLRRTLVDTEVYTTRQTADLSRAECLAVLLQTHPDWQDLIPDFRFVGPYGPHGG